MFLQFIKSFSRSSSNVQRTTNFRQKQQEQKAAEIKWKWWRRPLSYHREPDHVNNDLSSAADSKIIRQQSGRHCPQRGQLYFANRTATTFGATRYNIFTIFGRNFSRQLLLDLFSIVLNCVTVKFFKIFLIAKRTKERRNKQYSY